jgi:Arc/MetJ-type ribon-helix-helix transcriptional regulator
VPDKKQVLLKVDPDLKEDWENHIEEHGKYSSLSHFLRFSANTQRRRDQSEEDDSELPIRQARKEILEELDDIDKTVNRIDNQLLPREEHEEQYDAFRSQIDTLDRKWTQTIEQAADRPTVMRETVRDIQRQVVQKIDEEIETVNGKEIDITEAFTVEE